MESSQEQWAYIWLEVKLEIGSGGVDPLVESLAYNFHHTTSKERTGLLAPALIIEQVGPYMR